MNIQYRRLDGSFVAEINGLPYHVTENEPALYAVALQHGMSAPYEPLLPPVSYVPDLSFPQLLIGLVAEQWITEVDGEAWLAGTLPAAVLEVISSLPTEMQFPAKARALRPSMIVRADPLVAALATYEGKTPEELDQFFLTYAQV